MILDNFITVFLWTHIFVGLKVGVEAPDVGASQRQCLHIFELLKKTELA